MDIERVKSIFAAADSRSPQAFSTLMTDDIFFRYANNPGTVGKAPLEQALAELYAYVIEMHHDIVGVHQAGDIWTVETVAHYVDIHGRSWSFPGCSLLKARGEKICDYRIFVDNGIMFQPPTA
ncbi:nuclear transport factor 2 family protein [Sphingosinicella sp. LHD-64]|uniref:nuclear transport factor 2 family protein n=1 Tax=Sphingosinicella sp. LHD-64 TaxID=3072139 RepID=UPI00280DDD5B|nr:nuclear transport factor 2 family protein [Sphingosinicella sp. LHD-64]MDQ8757434.1 nuclear transport factor 2 family protein [Sphingosinicella sp. LHD-64]